MPEFPPVSLTLPCLPPSLPLNTYGDAVEYIEPALDVIDECDDRFAAIRKWRESRELPVPDT